MLFNQQHPLVDADSTFTGSKGHNSPMDRGTSQHGMQNKIVVTSTNTDGISTDQLQEATSQWELAKDMGVTFDTNQAIIINKIRVMENRDRKEPEALGNKNILS